MSGIQGTRTYPGAGDTSDLKYPLGTRLREALTEVRFHQLFGGEEQEPELPAERRFPRLFGLWRLRARACSGTGAWRLLLARLPPLHWLPHYRWRAWLLGDAVAGVTVGIVHVPQGMAFALLASVPPVFGLYTSFFPVLIYSLLGTGRHLSTGTFAILSLMTGSAVERLVPEPLVGNLSGIEKEQLDAQRVGVAAAVAFGSGALMLGMFVLQLGVLSTFLSEPVVKALTSGVALHVLVSQLPSLLGLSLPRQIGCFSLFKTLAAVLTALPRSSPAELTISALSLALLVPVKELNVRFRDRLPTPIPGEVVMVLLASMLCFASSLDTRYHVQIVGLLPGGTQLLLTMDPSLSRFPQPLLPNLAELPRILADSLPIALVTFAVSASLASIYADKYSYTIDSNQAVWMVTWVAVVTLNVDLGLAVGVVFSMMTVVCRTRRVQCLALGQAEGTELYRPLRGSHKLLQVPGLCILSYPTPLYFGTRGQFRRNLEWHLGLGEEKETSKPDGPTVAVAEPVRVVVLDFSGVTFADAAGAREVVQLASRCRDARIRLLLAQCNASVLGTLTRAGLLDRVTPDQLFVSVQDAAAYALGSLVRGSSTRSESREALGCGK
ncbi:solute carrier family 26 member 10 isoform X7 [Rhinopithecus roxellana]|uniref:solute carrier family 26 member 10 isoform X7 n=1 Tax=Rhinopithecus roxellana TaxID=61622 RepID=UPI0012371BD0|nr:solute carrier family 26 member 10 isoform X7 [Rhinopithecus roxellana]